ncbi:uncharacterized protein LOC100206956 [Hydra vulgaris]|uniref:uncharacterized protein LOC100206956 n=1 Tax=Hydra vulgaris TaxID=6087 RepID=UPI001F5E5F4B|nr:uncharacterized protein LOC100206956 [Hydra vulgaris]
MFRKLENNKDHLIYENKFGTTAIDVDDENDFYNEKPLKRKDITLWFIDAVVLLIEHLQYYAVLLSFSDQWEWPINWINATSFTLLFNFDIWEFNKVFTGAFNHSASSYVDSSKLNFNYMWYFALWILTLVLIYACFVFIYVKWMNRRPLYMLLYIARWKRVMFVVLELLGIPFGVVGARIFHCRLNENGYVMDVNNATQCLNVSHLFLAIFVSLIFFLWFLCYPYLLRKWISEQIFSGDRARHEGYLQLKEAEYEQGLNKLWELNQYHLFSSFQRSWVFYNQWKFIFKFALIVAFAFSIRAEFWSSAVVTLLFFVATLTVLIQQPFRVRCFNSMLAMCHFILFCNSLIGNFTVRPPWVILENFQIVSFLRYPTILQMLEAINIVWLLFVFLWIVYLFLLNNSLLTKGKIWPRLSYSSTKVIGNNTMKYLMASLKARQTLKNSTRAIPLFAPVHELAHEIKVINAFCREAEILSDPTHDTLWDLLDELIEAHNELSPVSVFGMSVKSSVRETSEEFIRLMPSFRKRLMQREYDFILISPLKRRILLKMYTLGVFISRISKKKRTTSLDSPKLFDSLSIDTEIGFSSGTSIQWDSEFLRSESNDKYHQDIDGMLSASNKVASDNKQNRVVFIDEFSDEEPF